MYENHYFSWVFVRKCTKTIIFPRFESPSALAPLVPHADLHVHIITYKDALDEPPYDLQDHWVLWMRVPFPNVYDDDGDDHEEDDDDDDGAISASAGAFLRPSWAILRPPWPLVGHLGALLARLGPLLGPLGTVLGPSCGHLDPLGPLLCPSWAPLRTTSGPLDPLLAPS